MQAAHTTVCRALKKSEMLSRKSSKLQHGLTVDRIIEIHPSCRASVLRVESYRFTCEEQLLLSPGSLPDEVERSLLVDRGRAGEPE